MDDDGQPTTTGRQQEQHVSTSPHAKLKEFGSAVTLAIQLTHYEEYGLRDRLAYHLALLRDGRPGSSRGIHSILECVSTKRFRKFDGPQLRLFKRTLKKLSLPFRVSPQTRVYFAYETTRLVFVVDASPTLTSTLGFPVHSSTSCLDSLVSMASEYFRALVQPIPCQYHTWQPDIAVTVMAVFPRDKKYKPTTLLVRNFRIGDAESAEVLLSHFDEWCRVTLRSEIAERLNQTSGALPVKANSMQDLLDAGHTALASLSSAAKPCIVIASDCRALAYDIVDNASRVDVPVSVLDISRPGIGVNSHADMMSEGPMRTNEFVFRVCQATFGAYWDTAILSQAINTIAGNVPASSALNRDHFFTYTRHTLRANAVQWYTLLELSLLSPVPQPEWGRLSPTSLSRPTARRGLQSRTTLTTYGVTAPLHDLLLLRAKQGYRAKQCLVTSSEPDRFSINAALTLQLDLVTTLHYELSYRAGSAQVKIELSGDSTFVLSVKNDLIGRNGRPVTMAQHVSAKLCAHIAKVRREDLMQSHLSPTQWSDHLASNGTPFIQRLSSLSAYQYQRHFSRDEFECVCNGRMPWEDGTIGFGVDRDGDRAEALLKTVRSWSTQQILENVFVRKLDRKCEYVVVKVERQSAYASRLFTVSIDSFASTDADRRLAIASELKAEIKKLKSVEILPKQMGPFLVGCRSSSKSDCAHDDSFLRILESQYNHASWDLVKDVELIPLVMRRRKEVGKFMLLESNETHTLFAKLTGCDGDLRDPGTHVQYRLTVVDDKVVVDLFMEFESQLFFPLRQKGSQFLSLLETLTTREKECARALQCRTLVLNSIEADVGQSLSNIILGESLASCVRRLLTYATTVSLPLRFFGSSNEAGNQCLRRLTTEALIHLSSGAKVAAIAVRDGGSGDWFAVRHDKETLSLVYLSQLATVAEGNPSVRMDIHTISLDQMYRKQDDREIEGLDSGNDGQYQEAILLRDKLDYTHKRRVAIAAYLTLQCDNPDFESTDFEEILLPIEFVQVSEISIPGESDVDRCLSRILSTVLKPVGGVPGLFVYKKSEDIGTGSSFASHRDGEFDFFSFDGTASDDESRSAESEDEADQGSLYFDEQSLTSEHDGSDEPAPIFVRFLKDGQLVTTPELVVPINSARIGVLVSIFKTSDDNGSDAGRKISARALPKLHLEAAFQILTLFHAYSAEQTLERLRAYGLSIDGPNIKLARSCLRKARKVLSIAVDVYLYSMKADTVVQSCSLSFGDTGVDEGFRLVEAHLVEYAGNRTLIEFGPGSYLLTEQHDTSLCYWCFLLVDKIRGVFLVDVWHPEGEMMANCVLEDTADLVAATCHRVNQLILLQHLHQSRCASELLVGKVSVALDKDKSPDSFTGPFGCEVVHKENIELYHRCAANVNQVILSLEASVLQNFAVSNRRGLFVYKDEAEHVFYIYLRPNEGEDSIELIVRGVSSPGPSICCQLVNLLKRRILKIGVDLLASVLTLKPLYLWKEEDLRFVAMFEETWNTVDDTQGEPQPQAPRERMYTFPDIVYDPGLLMFFFRQNILGSSYIYPVTAAADSAEKGETVSVSTTGNSLWLHDAKMMLYFNASRSKLDPSMQSENTLTERGAALTRKAGSGLALVTITLENTHHMEMALPLATTEGSATCFESEKARLNQINNDENSSGALLRVKISDTMLDRDALFEFIVLCFNQVIVAWIVERHMQRMQQGQLAPTRTLGFSVQKDVKYHNLCPGLPYLISILETSHNLPHPAIQIMEMKGVIRSSSVASCLHELLRSIVDEFPARSRHLLKNQGLQQRIMRASRDGNVTTVRLELSSDMRVQARVVDDNSGLSALAGTVVDSPIDCPEYLVYFSTNEYAHDYKESTSFPKVFNDVSVTLTPESTGSNEILDSYKKSHADQFRRSFGFILVVKRNVRKLYAYNWSAPLLNKVAKKLQDIDKVNLWRVGKIVESSLSDCIRGLVANKPLVPIKQTPRRFHDFGEALSVASESDKERVGTDSKPPKKAQSIRRPKLVGKSVDGSAEKAQAKARERARFKPQLSASANASSTRSGDTRPGNADGKMSNRPPKPNKSTESSAKRVLNDVEEKGNLRLKRNHDAKVHRSASDSIAAVNCSFFQSAGTLLTNHEKLPNSTIDYIFQSGARCWLEVADAPFLPTELDSDFLGACALLFCQSIPKLRLLSVQDINRSTALYLQSRVRLVSKCKCFLLVKLDAIRMVSNSRWRLVAEGRLLRAPRPRMTQKRFGWQSLFERDGAAFNILSAKIRNQLRLRPQLFDLSMSRFEKALLSSSSSGTLLQEVLSTLTSMTTGFALQPRSVKSSYKCFQLELKLPSYENKMISSFSTEALMRWLHRNALARNLQICTDEMLCARRALVVNNARSIFSIRRDAAKAQDSVFATVLCDTQWQDIERLVRRDDFSFLVTTFDLIAFEIAGVVYRELLFAAKAMRQGELWMMFGSRGGKPALAASSDFPDLLKLCHTKSALDLLFDEDKRNFISLAEGCIPNRNIQRSLGDDSSFSPHCYFKWPSGAMTDMFFLETEDLFLLLNINADQSSFSVLVLDRDPVPTSSTRALAALQKLTNFMLHHLWTELVAHCP